jgi:hypothetical protein
MLPLTIEYVTEGRNRGYNFTSPTGSYDDATLKTIWRSAMPRGQGWGVDALVGARSLKCFALDERRLALAEVIVTDRRDESGRRGIRRATVRVLYAEPCAAYLRERLRQYAPEIRERVSQLPTPRQWGQIVDRLLPTVRKEKQLVLTQPYDDHRWQIMEALVIKLALSLQVGLPRFNAVIPFTTLALDPREEAPIVAVPTAQLASGNHTSAVEIALRD